MVSADTGMKAQAALELATKRRIAPHLEGGRPVVSHVEAPVRFVAVD
ncbi:MAG: hypothetical protein ACHP84_18530 [Caulobacterales bacterium]